MTNTAIDAKEIPFPAMAQKPGQKSARAFHITGLKCNIGVLYAVEPHLDDGGHAVHVSISKSSFGRTAKITNEDLENVERVVSNNGLRWPEKYDKQLFTAGPFKSLGVHLWETP